MIDREQRALLRRAGRRGRFARDLSLLLTAAWLLGWLVLDSGWVREAGPLDGPEELYGDWVLDDVAGGVAPHPPRTIRFDPGAAPDRLLLSDGQRSVEVALHGNWMESTTGADLAPLLPDAGDVHVALHACPPLPQWDHLYIRPDFGRAVPDGHAPRTIRYERE